MGAEQLLNLRQLPPVEEVMLKRGQCLLRRGTPSAGARKCRLQGRLYSEGNAGQPVESQKMPQASLSVITGV